MAPPLGTRRPLRTVADQWEERRALSDEMSSSIAVFVAGKQVRTDAAGPECTLLEGAIRNMTNKHFHSVRLFDIRAKVHNLGTANFQWIGFGLEAGTASQHARQPPSVSYNFGNIWGL